MRPVSALASATVITLIILIALLLTACSSTPEPSPEPVAIEPTYQPWFAGVDLAAYLDCAREQHGTLLQAHRAGDRPGAAENSLGAIEASLDDGAVFLEIDVAQTADGVLVLMHDRTVDRTTNGTGTVTELTAEAFAQLQLVDVDGRLIDEAPPTLAGTFDALDGRGIAQIDLKGVAIDTIADAIKAANAAERSIVITYSIEDAIALHRRLPEVMFSVGIDELSELQPLIDAGVDLTRMTAWLGADGTGNPTLDAELAYRGIETSYGNFRGEREGTVDYELMANNGAEVISVDDMPAAANALDASARARALLAACPAAKGS
ncbi:MAG: glycerophosphodiester phosphodiesterase family protein [Pseudomonadota bacterium]